MSCDLAGKFAPDVAKLAPNRVIYDSLFQGTWPAKAM